MSYAYLYGLGQTATPDLAQWQADVAIAQRAGIPVVALKAIRQTESGGHADAIRFEPRIFNMLTNNRYQSQFPSDTGSSGTGTAPPAAFNRAYALDPTNAVKATSYGSYQVLIRDAGPQIWAAAGGTPAGFIRMFNANPQAVSEQIVASWFNNRPPAQAAAKALDWVQLAHRYNGCAVPCDTYAGHLRTAYARWEPEWEQVRSMLPASVVQAAEQAASTVTAHPIITALGALTVSGGVAAAAYYVLVHSKRPAIKRNRRRRRSSRRYAYAA